MKKAYFVLAAMGFVLVTSHSASAMGLKHPHPTSTPTPTPAATPKPSATPLATPVASTTPVPTASNGSGGIALVWNGAGACDEGCAQAGADAAQLAGLTPKFINEKTSTKSATDIAAIFAGAKVWVMPGGMSNDEVRAMTSTLKDGLRSFVSSGGGYVGWCAGAFASTANVGSGTDAGLGLMPGKTDGYSTTSKQNRYHASIEKTTWFNDTHYFYLEGGPYLYNLPSSVEVVGRYDDQVSVSAARTQYGNGRVFVSGVHPEAPVWWWQGTNITDPDGSDLNYAADMIKWASHLE